MRKEAPKIEAPQDWGKAINFVPKKDQIIIYDGIKDETGYVILPKMKIGDGIHTVSELPFETGNSIEYIEDSGILVIN